jgi:HlyD family secretion protein
MAANKGFPWGKLLVFLIVFGGIGYGGYYYFKKPKTKAPQYRTAKITRGDVVQLVSATGQLEPVINVQVGSQVSGIIEKLYVDFNSAVTNGQLIAKLDPATFQANADQAEGDLANAQASLELTQVNAKRSKELRAADLIPQSDDDKAIADLHQAQAVVKIRQASLEKAKVDLSRATIYSPIDGVVISRNVDVGQTVAASLSAPTLFVIANDLRKMQIPAMVSEADIGGIEENQETTFKVEAFPTRSFNGRVSQVRNQPTTNQNVVTYATMIEVQNGDLKLKPGMTATVFITTAKKQNSIQIPNAALRFRAPENALVKTNAVATQAGKNSAPEEAAGAPGGGGGFKPSEEQRQKMLARFDKNGDGKLDDEERAAMRQAMRGEGGFGGGGGRGRGKPEAQPVKTVYLVSSNIVDAAKGPQLEAVRIKIGISDNINTEVIEGLKEGDVVAVGTIGAEAPAAGPAGNPFGGGRRF